MSILFLEVANMGREQHYAALHLVKPYIKTTDMVSPIDKYGTIIAENILSKKTDPRTESILSDVKTYNDIRFWDEKCESKNCLKCGYRTSKSNRIEIFYKNNKELKTVVVDGKICRKCGRKCVVKETIIDSICC